MLKLIWMSDPHFLHEGKVLGHDPRVRIDAAVDHVNALYPDASMCVITGDMVNRGVQAGYAALRDRLDRLAMPYLPMTGNHDDRALLRNNLPLPDNCMADFIQYSVQTPEGIIVCLDTLKPGSGSGELCDARLGWLRGVLEDAGETPVFLFMHHPPMALGLPMQDTENLDNGSEFLDLVSGYDCVKYMFIGHVHRPISGTARGIPFSTMRSVLYQAPPPQPEWNWDTFKPGTDAPNLGIITISDGSVNLQYEQFCGYEVGVATKVKG